MSRRRFERWRVSIPAGASRPTSPAEWADAVVLVERGTLEVTCIGGASARFGAGSLLALGWLPVGRLRSPGPQEVELLAVRRRRTTGPDWWADVPVTRWTMAMVALARASAPPAGAQEDGLAVDG
jgi:hypothetical protein